MLGATLIMEGSVVEEQGQLKITARLVDGVLDRKVWVGEYTGPPGDLAGLEARIAAEAGPAALKIAGARPPS
jgi:TolB-like protein